MIRTIPIFLFWVFMVCSRAKLTLNILLGGTKVAFSI